VLGTVQRAGDVLELFSVRPEWGATSVANELSIAKSQAHEVLVSLSTIGLLRRTRSARYRLGWRAVTLGSDVIRGGEFTEDAARIMPELTNGFREASVHLAAWDRGRAVCIARRAGSEAARAVHGVLEATGHWVEPHCTSVGKVLLAARSTEDVDALLENGPLESFTPYTIVQPELLRAELEAVRERGFALDHGELLREIRCVAAPIESYDGEVIAALGLCVSADRWAQRNRDYTRAVIAATQNITRRIRSRAQACNSDEPVCVAA